MTGGTFGFVRMLLVNVKRIGVVILLAAMTQRTRFGGLGNWRQAARDPLVPGFMAVIAPLPLVASVFLMYAFGLIHMAAFAACVAQRTFVIVRAVDKRASAVVGRRHRNPVVLNVGVDMTGAAIDASPFMFFMKAFHIAAEIAGDFVLVTDAAYVG